MINFESDFRLEVPEKMRVAKRDLRLAPLGQEAGAKTFRCQAFMDRLV
jgi:hypothetical protein